MKRPSLLPATLLLLASCAYYNGLYNAKDFANRAEKAEREGRTFEAQSDWGQAAMRAESVLVHHPRSRWAEEARWLDGKALERMGNCPAAIPQLQRTLREAGDARRADDAALRLSACQLKLGDIDAAGLAVERLLQHPDARIRNEAAWRTGTTYRRTGRSEEAVRVLRTSAHPRARGELAAALADAGDLPGAYALADSLLAERDSLAPWGAIFASIGRRAPERGSDLVDRAVATLHPVPDTTAAWLTADALRWLTIDTSRADHRLIAAHDSAPDRPAGLEALLAALRMRLASSEDPAILDSVRDLLSDLAPSTGPAQFRARALGTAVIRARADLDSIAPDAPQGDLRAFLLGETMRDSLGAPRLAAVVWRRLVADRPSSPYAPKALIALAAVGGAPADSVLGVLAVSYAGSPYLHVLRGVEDGGFAPLEDSLARFARTQARGRPSRPATRGARPAAAQPNTPLP